MTDEHKRAEWSEKLRRLMGAIEAAKQLEQPPEALAQLEADAEYANGCLRLYSGEPYPFCNLPLPTLLAAIERNRHEPTDAEFEALRAEVERISG